MGVETIRQRKFAKEVQRELSKILQQEVEGAVGAMITLTYVKATPDLQLVRAYLTTLPDAKLPQVLALLAAENRKLRQLLAQQIKHLVKVMPVLEFYQDDTQLNAARLDQLFDRIRPKDENETDH